MHGEISLESELGQGTKTTFWINFQKAHIETSEYPLVDLGQNTGASSRLTPTSYALGGAPDRPNFTEAAFNARLTESMAATQSPLKAKAGSVLATSPQKITATMTNTDSEAPPSELDRKGIHVLVVEDK